MRNFLLGIVAAVILMAAGFYLFISRGYFPIEADAKPGELEEHLADIAVGASVRRHAKRMPNPIAETEANLLDGLKLYRNNCAGCHGDGSGSNAFGDAFYPPVPQFKEDPPGTHDDLIYYRIVHGIRLTGMPAFGKMMKEDEMWKVALLLSHLKKLPAAVETQWKTAPKNPS